MAGKKKKARKVDRANGAARPERLTTDQYHEAWNLFAAGSTPKQICRTVGLSAPQLLTLYREGLPARGRRHKPLIGFEQRLIEEQAAIRSEAVTAGKALSHVGARYLDKAIKNADTAETLIQHVFRLFAERMEWALSLPVADRPDTLHLLPGKETMKALQILNQISGKAKDAAQIYRMIFDDPVARHPSTRGALDLAGKTSSSPNIPGAGKESMPAALAFMDGVAGDSASTAMLEEMMKEVTQWSPEQRRHYADTGEEPDPNDVIDVEAG